jgi:hypothetical protein
MERGPVYVAGAERSGTSLLYALLASHPNIAMVRRTNLWTYFNNRFGDLSKPENFERCLAMMRQYKRLVIHNLNFERLRSEFLEGERTYGHLIALVGKQFAEKAGKPRWGDKSLDTERFADAIFASFPAAKIIHLIRDPRDRYASALKRWKVNRGGVGAGIAVWLDSVKFAERNKQRYPENYLIVHYETLANQPEETLQKICEFLGEEYTPLMLSMMGAKTFRDQGGNSSYGQRAPGQISTHSIGRFREVLPHRKIAFIQWVAGQKMLAHGYDTDPVRLDLSEKILFAAFDLPVNLVLFFAWQMNEWIWDRRGRTVPPYRILPDKKTSNAQA